MGNVAPAGGLGRDAVDRIGVLQNALERGEFLLFRDLGDAIGARWMVGGRQNRLSAILLCGCRDFFVAELSEAIV